MVDNKNQFLTTIEWNNKKGKKEDYNGSLWWWTGIRDLR